MGIIAMNFSDSADEPADDCGPAVKITLQTTLAAEIIIHKWRGDPGDGDVGMVQV